MRRLALVTCLLAVVAPAVALGAAGDSERERFHTRVLAIVPPPGFPAHAYVHPGGRVYVGTYTDPSGSPRPSRVFEYTRRGTLLQSWTVPRQDLSAPHGVQVATSDAHGALLLLDRTPARALKLNRRTGRFRRYATFRDLSPCRGGRARRGCSPTLTDEPPVPNFAAWGRDGSLYVTDYQQGVVWRVPRGGGRARVWIADRRLDGGAFGTTGIELAADRRTLLIAQQSSAGLGGGNPSTGKLYAVRIRRGGGPGAMRKLWESAPLDGPDGFALGRSGRIYMSLIGSNQLAVISPRGRELRRFPREPATGRNGSSVPFDNPSSAAFLGRRLMVANQSFAAGDRSHQAILDVYAGERGVPELVPRAPARRPRS